MELESTEDTGPIELVVPGTSRHIRLARLMAGGIATTYGLSMQFIEDVRIAVDEICATLIETGRGQPLKLTFTLDDDALVVTGTTRDDPQQGANRRRLAISRRILEVLTDTHQFAQQDGQATFTVTIPLGNGHISPD